MVLWIIHLRAIHSLGSPLCVGGVGACEGQGGVRGAGVGTESSRPAGASTESASGRCLSTVSIEICSAQADRHAITSSRT